ncbi:MAG TPA: glycoside hydrolase family protein [Acidobacteriaceae bacterium]|jgi:lysozyme
MIDEAAVTRRLVLDEDEVLHAYPDSKGYLTIGVGILIDERKGGGITQEESRYLLRNRIERKAAECENRFEWWHSIDDVRQGVILCMAFQLGTNGVANFRRMCAALRIRDYITASLEMLDSEWYRKDSPQRAERMATIMKTGVWQ